MSPQPDKTLDSLLKESEQRYRFLAESIPQMVWTATSDGLLDYVNSQGTAYFGVGQEALLGTGWLERVHPDDQERTVANWQESLRTGKPYETMFRLRRSDESWRWHLARALPYSTNDGVVSQWIGTCTDIQDQKQAQTELQQQWQTFDSALSNTVDFTYTFDVDGRFTYSNAALLSLLRISLDEIRGKNFHDLNYPSELATRLQMQIQQVIDTRQKVRDRTEFTGPDGEPRFYEYIFVPVLDAEGRTRAVAGSTRDITEQNKAENELRRMNRELEEFAYVASHDLQEPLRMVNIYTQMILRNNAEDKEKLEGYGRFVREGVERMEALIQDLLTYSRSVHMESTPLGAADLSAAFAEACAVLRSRIDETGAAFEIPETFPFTCGETPQMAHVFQNVISNALKYRRSDPPVIKITAAEEGSNWVISIQDNGIGFEPQYAQRIFGLFKRLHKEEYAGTGLGLAICQRIIERYGGRMWAEGKPGEGATFYFSLPSAPMPEAGRG